MATYSKVKLSGSTDGKAIKLVTVTTPGTLIHTADPTALDEIHLWLQNTQAAAAKVTIEWGEATAPDGNIIVTVPGQDGLFYVIPGLLLTNSLAVKAFTTVSSGISVHGFVNRIS